MTRPRGSWKHRGVGLLVALATGCSTVPAPEPVRAPPRAKPEPAPVTSVSRAELDFAFLETLNDRSPNKPKRIEAPMRSSMTRSMGVDYAEIPLMKEATRSSPADGSTFQLVASDGTSHACFRARKKTLWRARRAWDMPAIIRVGGLILPPLETIDGRYEDLSGGLEVAITSGKRVTAEWITLDERHRSPSDLDVHRFEGDLVALSGGLLGDAKRELSVTAKALIPGVLYAFRRCRSHCDDAFGSAARIEELEILGPPALWVGSSTSTDRQKDGPPERFTDLSAPIARGSSANLSIAIADSELASFRDAVTPHERTEIDPLIAAFSIDVVWPTDGDPEMTLFTGSLEGAPKELTAQRYQLGPPPDCPSLDIMDP